MIFFDAKTQKYVHVWKGPNGNFSFYRTTNLRKKGARIHGLQKNENERWFDTEKAAQEALLNFAKKRNFIPATGRELYEKKLIRNAPAPSWWTKRIETM